MDFDQLLNVLRERGLVPRLDSMGRLALAGPLERFDQSLREAVRQHRPRLVAFCVGQGTLLALRAQGEAAPLLLLPGLASQPHVFAGLAAAASWRRPLYGIAYPAPGTAPTLEVLVAWLAKRLAPLFSAPFHLGGHSFGGLVASALAERLSAQGTAPQSLVLFDSRTPVPSDLAGSSQHTVAIFLECLTVMTMQRPLLQASEDDLIERVLDPDSWPQGLPMGLDHRSLCELWERCLEGQRQFLEFRACAPPPKVLAVVAGRVPDTANPLLYAEQAQLLILDRDHEGVLAPSEAERVAIWLETACD